MRQKLRVTEPAELEKITDVIHDYWFEVDEVTFDGRRRSLQIPFQRPQEGRDRDPIVEWALEISSVDSYELEESENVGRYDFNKLDFSEEEGVLTIKTGIPLLFQARVSDLDVSVFSPAPP